MGSEGTRLGAFAWARKMFEQGFMVIDFQTSDLAHRGGRICQVGLVDAAGNILMDQLVNPVVKIAPEAFRIHGLSDQQLANAPDIETIWAKVSQVRGSIPLVSYGQDFDRSVFINSIPHEACIAIPEPFEWFCLMDIFAPVAGKWNQYRENYQWVKLMEACRIAGVQGHDPGSAIANCFMVRDVMEWLSKQVVQRELL